MIQRIKGTMDILPHETPLWRHIEGIMREEAEKYGFGEIRTPTFENTELFVRGVGDTTDVVQKEMYTFADREEDRSISLRPEGTASVARAIIENGKYSDPMPLKYYYIISCFRHEKPQAGRSREFYQFGTEMFGSQSPAADATIIALGNSVLKRLGLTNVKLHINSIGCKECRPAYREALVKYFTAHKDGLCDTCKTRLEKNPLRLLDCKSPECKKIAEGAPKTIEHLCEKCNSNFDTLGKALSAMNIDYEVDTNIVRGLDYYTGTVFEFIAEGIGAQSTVCGGGRYDGLVSSLGGPELSGIGFGMGITRLILALRELGLDNVEAARPTVYIASLGERAMVKGLEITERLRAAGKFAECDVVGRSLKAQMKYANKIGAEYTLIIGDSEVDAGKAQLRNMQSGEQTEVSLDSFII
ncbi:MAG: histidine--tRNA ligase [Clostridia bacterium]|nr:histidine--tRNA ligase [Clostridia bacterium]